ncbi:MAG: hypothetical protein A2066_00795 [Bacteroidetes bacterium GWB2_41_8]|nr:MAG: hypothetical protein A2066_00795 [Bacteroidetes bacterium GWB2_41_8]
MKEENLLFVIYEVFNISNVGTVVTAEILNEVEVNDKVIIASPELTALGFIESMEVLIDKKPLKIDRATFGDNVGIYLNYPKEFKIKQGMHVYRIDK